MSLGTLLHSNLEDLVMTFDNLHGEILKYQCIDPVYFNRAIYFFVFCWECVLMLEHLFIVGNIGFCIDATSKSLGQRFIYPQVFVNTLTTLGKDVRAYLALKTINGVSLE